MPKAYLLYFGGGKNGPVGIALACLQVSILPSIALIGVTTFILSVVGVALGNRFGMKYNRKAEMAGGLVLIIIGLKILGALAKIMGITIRSIK